MSLRNDESVKRVLKFSPPDITEAEIEAVGEALRSGWITTGPRTKLLEKRLAAYIDTSDNLVDIDASDKQYMNRAVCLASATAAEELNLRILGVGPGDEVIVPAYTYTSTASAALHLGARVVMADILKDGSAETHAPEMDYDKVAELITDKTKAVVAVDIAGIACDYDRLYQVVEAKKALYKPLSDDSDASKKLASRIQQSLGRPAVLADAAHSLGASRRMNGSFKNAGQLADFTSFSFHAVKNFTTAEGGAAAWKTIDGVDDSEIYHMYQLMSLHGQSKDALAKTKQGAWEYDIVGPWYKCNMTDVMAAIGLVQLDRYKKLLDRRYEIIKRYDEAMDELGVFHLNHETENSSSSRHLYTVRIPGIDSDKRTELIEEISETGVPLNVHYKPLPMMTAYRNLGLDIADYPNSYDFFSNLITLPLHTLLTDEDVDFILDNFKKVIKKVL